MIYHTLYVILYNFNFYIFKENNDNKLYYYKESFFLIEPKKILYINVVYKYLFN